MSASHTIVILRRQDLSSGPLRKDVVHETRARDEVPITSRRIAGRRKYGADGAARGNPLARVRNVADAFICKPRTCVAADGIVTCEDYRFSDGGAARGL